MFMFSKIKSLLGGPSSRDVLAIEDMQGHIFLEAPDQNERKLRNAKCGLHELLGGTCCTEGSCEGIVLLPLRGSRVKNAS